MPPARPSANDTESTRSKNRSPEGEKIMTMNDLKNISKDDILAALGLETRHTMGDHLGSGLLMLGIGLAVGVGIGMMLAPKSGGELREDLGNRYRKTVGMAHDAVADQSTARSATTSATGMGSAGTAGPKPV
jgi:hypothetical protein